MIAGERERDLFAASLLQQTIGLCLAAIAKEARKIFQFITERQIPTMLAFVAPLSLILLPSRSNDASQRIHFSYRRHLYN
jgi:hypothetical protein